MTRLTEAQWQAQVLDLARLHRWLVHHCRPALRQSGRWSTPITGDPGFPDLVLLGHGRVLFVELKSDRGQPTIDQRRWWDALEDAGAEWFCWRPRDFDEVREELALPATRWKAVPDRSGATEAGSGVG